jgi:hypothetical protein
MAHFAIITIEPQGYIHARAFDEIRLLLYHSLRDLGHGVDLRTNRFQEGAINLLLGAHLLDPSDEGAIPSTSIVFNTEQLGGDFERWTERILALAARFPVWDYSTANLRFLHERLTNQPPSRFALLRLGYHRRLQRIERQPRRGDSFLFFGSTTPLRKSILGEIRLSERLQVESFFGVYGWSRDGLLSRCRACLNLHAHPSRILEWPRILHLLANRIPCIALLHPDTQAEDGQLDLVLGVEESNPTPGLEELFGQPELLERHAASAWERFSLQAQAPFTAEALDHTYTTESSSGSAGELPPTWLSPPPWPATGRDEPVEARWYLHTYQWTYSDPRSTEAFHREEGCYRQYHPHPAFAARVLKAPIHLEPEPFDVSVPEALGPVLRCAAVLHFHTPSKARQFFADFGCHLVGAADFFVTTSEPLVGQVLLTLAQEYAIEAMQVRILPNIGRDLPSKYIVFNSELQAYDLCLFSHGKESDGQWFHDHNTLLCGSAARVAAIQALFAREAGLGLLYPDYLSSLLWLIGWGNMRPEVDSLLAPFGCDTSGVELLEFPAGGFFWARPAALTLLHSLDLTLEALPPEPLAADNTLLHALERMPCLSCELMGLRWEKLAREVA